MNTVELKMEGELLPWHKVQWQSFIHCLRTGRLPHALLLTGLRGLGKNHFARFIAQAILCTQPRPDGQACTLCRPCLLYLAGTHPDCRRVSPSEEGRDILVDQIRDINAYMALKSHYAGYKIVIISPAERMNPAASNSLLKTLEEPAAPSILVLVTSQPALLLPTVRSRCQRIHFTRPPESLAQAWLADHIDAKYSTKQLLALAGGAPLVAVDLATNDTAARRLAMLDDLGKLAQGQADPLAIAAKWLQWGIEVPLYGLLSWAEDMIRLKSAPNPPYLANRGIQQSLQQFAERLELTELYSHLNRINEALLLANRQISPQLPLESILLSWSRMVKQQLT